MEQLLEHHYATTHITSLIPTPSSPPTNSQTTLLIKQTLSFLSLYRLPHPFFKSPEYAERWDHLARDAESRIEEYKRQHESMARGMLIRERESLWKHVNGADDPRRPITQLFRTSAYGYPADSAPEVFKMVSTVYRKMIHASRQIEHASAIVFVGHRDWDELSRWERINVALAAKEYFEEKRAIAQALQQVASSSTAAPGIEPYLKSLGRHSPSLTARQGRRNGISERELRARWGGGGVL